MSVKATVGDGSSSHSSSGPTTSCRVAWYRNVPRGVTRRISSPVCKRRIWRNNVSTVPGQRCVSVLPGKRCIWQVSDGHSQGVLIVAFHHDRGEADA